MNHLQFQSPVGTLAITWNAQGRLVRLDWYESGAAQGLTTRATGPRWSAMARERIPQLFTGLLDRLQGYFEAGRPIGEIPWETIDTSSWTDFQLQVYQAIAKIPHGETRTYSWVAKRVGRSLAPRAVGQALRKNPLPILIPCHRVVSSSQHSIGGFMGIDDPNQPELILKRRLIELEHNYLNPQFPFLTLAS